MLHRRGFTLVEMLVVVAIILLLAAIMLPVLDTATRKAESVSCLQNERNLALAAVLYSDEHDGRLVPALISTGTTGTADCWDTLLSSYLGGAGVYLCPSDQRPTPGPSWARSFRHSYGINLDLTMVGGYMGNSLLRDQISRPEETVFFFDMQREHAYGYSFSWGAMSQWVGSRHQGGANFVTCAGNAKWSVAGGQWSRREHWIP